jgi:hypothetical protein
MESIHHFEINYFLQIVLLGKVSVDRSKVDFELIARRVCKEFGFKSEAV